MRLKTREEEYFEINERYKDLIGLPWTGTRVYGCYEVIRQYFKHVHDEEMPDFNTRGIYMFTDESIQEAKWEWIYGIDADTSLDLSAIQFEDILVFKLYTNADGTTRSSTRRPPNHGGVYLGNSFMLHTPFNGESQIADLRDPQSATWITSCAGALRKKDI